MSWSQAAHQYLASFRQARGDQSADGPRFAVKTLAQQPLELPELSTRLGIIGVEVPPASTAARGVASR